jgi:hypothetical protein
LASSLKLEQQSLGAAPAITTTAAPQGTQLKPAETINPAAFQKLPVSGIQQSEPTQQPVTLGISRRQGARGIQLIKKGRPGADPFFTARGLIEAEHAE